MKTAFKHSLPQMACKFFIAVFAALCFLFPAVAARADQNGAINLIGNNGLCEVDGDFLKIFKPGDPIEVSRFNKPFGSGYIKQVNESYMLVVIVTRQNDYFLKEGDIVHKPIPKEIKKLKTLRAQIKTKEEEDAEAEIVGTSEKQGAIEGVEKTEVVETSENTPKSATDVQSILFERARTGGVLNSDTKSEKQGKLIVSDTKSGENTSQNTTPESNTKETKADSRRRKKAIENEQ